MNASAKIHLTPAKVKNKFVIRFVANQEGCNEQLIDNAWKTIQEFAREILIELSPLKKRPRASVRKLDRTHSQRFSFTRNVSQELYERQSSMYVVVFGHLLIVDFNLHIASQTKAHGWSDADCRHRHRRYPAESAACNAEEQGCGRRCSGRSSMLVKREQWRAKNANIAEKSQQWLCVVMGFRLTQLRCIVMHFCV